MPRHPPLVSACAPTPCEDGRMKRARTLTAALVAGALALSLSACGTDESQSANGAPVSITVGSLETPESQIVAQLYGQALAHEGYDVSYNPGIGDREQYIAALKSGVVDVVPETIGSLLAALAPGARYRDSATMVAAIETILEDQAVEKEEGEDPVQELRILEAAPAQDTYSFVMTKTFARTHNIVTLGDLAPIAAGVSIGSTPGFDALPIGRTGLDRSYGVRDWNFEPFDTDSARPLIEALEADIVQVIAIPSTSADISGKDLVVLGDPNGLVVSQNFAPLVSEKAHSGKLARVLNAVSKKFTTSDLRALGIAVAADSVSYENAAREWLLDKGLLD